MKRHKIYDPILVSLNRQQVESAKRVNGQGKRITHASLCGPYGQIFGTEKQCLQYYSVWLEIFPLLFAKRKRVKRAKLSDYKSTFNLVNDLIAAQDAISKHYRVPPRPSADKKGVLRDPSRDFADQLVLSISTAFPKCQRNLVIGAKHKDFPCHGLIPSCISALAIR